MNCLKCDSELIYEPYYCMGCEAALCLFCLSDSDPDIIMCKDCHFVQNNIVDIPKDKCPHTDHRGTLFLFDKYKCDCGRDMEMCSNHTNNCKSCNIKVCHKCSDYCINDGINCQICNKRANKYSSATCICCGVKFCNLCFDGINVYGLNICKKHLLPCEVGPHANVHYINQVKPFMCEFEGCKGMTSCSNLWFRKCKDVKSIDDIIKMCHKHVDICKGCGKNYPLTKTHNIKYKNNPITIKCCSNCFSAIQMIIYIFLVKYNFKCKDIIDIIIKNYFMV